MKMATGRIEMEVNVSILNKIFGKEKSDRSMTVYVAGPLTTSRNGKLVSRKQRERNVEKAMQAGLEVIQKGHWPFIPHLNYYFSEYIDESLDVRDYMEWDFAFLDKCDAMLYLGPSAGADEELERSKNAGRKIYYDVRDIPEYEKE